MKFIGARKNYQTTSEIEFEQGLTTCQALHEQLVIESLQMSAVPLCYLQFLVCLVQLEDV